MKRRKKGFTLVEIMLVVIIIGVLAAIVIPRFAGIGEEARQKRVDADVQAIKTALGMFELRYGHYPTEEEGGLKALVMRPPTITEDKWKKCMDKIPKDPWGEEYIYLMGDNRIDKDLDFNIYSKGPNRLDDRWEADDLPPQEKHEGTT
jgi:general secretion pathway protein G